MTETQRYQLSKFARHVGGLFQINDGERHYELEAHLVAAEAERLLGEPAAARERLDGAEKQAGDEATHLQPRLTLVRARVLAASGVTEGLAELIQAAEANAAEQGLQYERALLTLLRLELTPQAPPEPAAVAAAQRELEGLGVRLPA